MFGQYVKELRSQRRLGLREFCMMTAYDPSNWSKIERGILPPPQDEESLVNICSALGFEKFSPQFEKLKDLAAVCAGKIPDYVMADEELLKKLPLFFRTVTGKKPGKEELEKLVEIMREP